MSCGAWGRGVPGGVTPSREPYVYETVPCTGPGPHGGTGGSPPDCPASVGSEDEPAASPFPGVVHLARRLVSASIPGLLRPPLVLRRGSAFGACYDLGDRAAKQLVHERAAHPLDGRLLFGGEIHPAKYVGNLLAPDALGTLLNSSDGRCGLRDRGPSGLLGTVRHQVRCLRRDCSKATARGEVVTSNQRGPSQPALRADLRDRAG